MFLFYSMTCTFLFFLLPLSLSDVFVSLKRAQAALQAVNALHGGGIGNMAISTDAASMGGAVTTQSPVLRVIVENLFYPVTLDVLHQVQAAFRVLAQTHWIKYVV